MNKQHYVKNFSEECFARFLSEISSFPDCTMTGSKLAADDGHFNTYKFKSGTYKFSIHHDMRANILQLNAAEDVLERLIEIADCKLKEVASGIPFAPSLATQVPSSAPAAAAETKSKTAKPNDSKSKQKESKDNKKNVRKSAQSEQQKPVKTEAKKQPPEYKDGYSLKNYTLDRFKWAITALKKVPGVHAGSEKSTGAGTAAHQIQHVFTDTAKDRVIIQYSVKSKTVQLQGKRSELFAQAQIIVTEGGDNLETAVKAYIDYTAAEEQAQAAEHDAKVKKDTAEKSRPETPTAKADRTTRKVLNALKKKIPSAFPYLSEQSKAHLTFTMIDLGSNVRNYSGVLMPAFIALEHFISSLEKARGITVKLIGQAFAKDGECYILKPAYSKRIDSVIYDEVMSALYTEYNKRHKHVHSDLESGRINIIDKRGEAEKIFDEIMRVLDYNCKKLKEIAFFKDEQS